LLFRCAAGVVAGHKSSLPAGAIKPHFTLAQARMPAGAKRARRVAGAMRTP